MGEIPPAKRGSAFGVIVKRTDGRTDERGGGLAVAKTVYDVRYVSVLCCVQTFSSMLGAIYVYVGAELKAKTHACVTLCGWGQAKHGV